MIVLDASAAVDMVRQTEEGQALRQLMLNDEKVVSCELIHAEVASVFGKIAHLRGLSTFDAAQYVEAAIGLVDEFYPLGPLRVEAFRESMRLDHSAYDMFYFVLARRMGATLFTLDRRLVDLCLAHGVECVSLASLA